MVSAAEFPRVMRRGVFKGERLESEPEYAAALHAYRRRNGQSGRRRFSPTDEGTLSLVVKLGGLTLTLEGTTDERGLTAVLDALGQLDTINHRSRPST